MDWFEVLKAECDRSSQSKVAVRLGVSASAISQVLKGSYGADTTRLEARVRGEFMRETVDCPVLGELSRKACCDIQNQPFAATNPQRVALYKACRNGCPYSFLSGGEES